jgi:FixJ family two-component response regulator
MISGSCCGAHLLASQQFCSAEPPERGARIEDGSLSEFPLIAIVDDDEAIRLAAESLIRSLGFAARIFASAEAFLASDIVRKIDCLITDVQMPGMSGLDLQDVLIARGQQTPTIFITAYPEERFQKRARANGAAGILVKPFDGQSLADCLMGVLREGEER